MVRSFRCFVTLLVLILGAGRLRAASASENRAFDAAKNAFQNQFWDRAARGFADFVQKYPASMYRAEAIYCEAEAQITNGQYTAAISLLSTNQDKAGEWADDYVYLTAEAYLGGTNYRAAADEFAHLAKDFPESHWRLTAFVSEAAALGKLEQWPRVVDLLQQPDSVFQKSVRGGTTNDLVALGYLLLGEAQFAQNHLDAVEGALGAAVKLPLNPELKWRWHYLSCRLQLAEGQLDDAILTATNLLPLAQAAGQPELRAESAVLQAEMFKEANRPDDAIAALQQNLSDELPTERQRQALLEITHLLSLQNKTAEAITNLENYLREFPESEAADLAMLTLGELLLKERGAESGTNQVASTNLLPQAMARFDSLLQTFPSSPLAGKALLDKGWCLWEAGRTNDSAEQFRLAAARLPLSEDQAVARFKWADAQFAARDFFGATANYYWIVEHSGSLPEAKSRLLEPALYQIVRAAVTETNFSAAEDAMGKILSSYPDGFAGDRSLLLMGQAYANQKDTAKARQLFADFEKRFPSSPLIPDVRLALARAYEREGNWLVAISNYNDWVITFTNNAGLPQAEFCRALDNAKAGSDTNALTLFTNFVKRFAEDRDLAPRAQWWIGDYYFRQGDYQNAEKNYQLVYQQWQDCSLACEAKMMAGRSAMARLRYKDAIDYFTNLVSSADCSDDLKVQATFAYGDALRSQDSTNKIEDFNDAISVLRTIPLQYGTNAQTAPAWGEMGEYYFQLAALATNADYYTAASNSYQQVIASAKAGVSVRSQAGVGLGLVAEKRAALNPAAQVPLLNLALNDYLDVFYGNGLRDGETRDEFWTKEAGMNAARVAESLQQWPQAVEVYRKMEEWFPPLREALEKKILRIQDRPPDVKTQEAKAAP